MISESTITEQRAPAGRPATAKWKQWTITLAIVSAILLGLVIAFVYRETNRIGFSTPYQAVLLTNGAVYYGNLQGYGTSRPVLSNVFYIITRTNPDTKQVSNVLVKRGKELHGPDRMYLNPSQIVFVETVGRGSKVAQLIADSGNQ